jgi:hypothetical protein
LRVASDASLPAESLLPTAEPLVAPMLHDFHPSSKFEEILSATLIALISKNFEAIDLKDFWPISLVSGVYKIIAKVLAGRLRRD